MKTYQRTSELYVPFHQNTKQCIPLYCRQIFDLRTPCVFGMSVYLLACLQCFPDDRANVWRPNESQSIKTKILKNWEKIIVRETVALIDLFVVFFFVFLRYPRMYSNAADLWNDQFLFVLLISKQKMLINATLTASLLKIPFKSFDILTYFSFGSTSSSVLSVSGSCIGEKTLQNSLNKMRSFQHSTGLSQHKRWVILKNEKLSGNESDSFDLSEQ